MLHQRAKLGERVHGRAAELLQLLAILRRPLTDDIKQVIPDKDPGEVHVGSQFSQVGLDQPMMGTELVQLYVDLLRPTRRNRHRDCDQDDKRPEPECRHEPGFESHEGSTL